MDNDIKKQRYYIYENINKLNNHNQIIELINLKTCKYTENDNGIFLNLNTVEDEIISLIYNIVLNTIDYKEKLYEIEETTDLTLGDNVSDNVGDNLCDKKTNKVKKINKNKLTYKHFSKEEQKIIDYSKKYNL